MRSCVRRMHARCSSHVRANSKKKKKTKEQNRSMIHRRSYAILDDRSRRDDTISPVPLRFIGNNRERGFAGLVLENDRRGNYNRSVCRTFCSVHRRYRAIWVVRDVRTVDSHQSLVLTVERDSNVQLVSIHN